MRVKLFLHNLFQRKEEAGEEEENIFFSVCFTLRARNHTVAWAAPAPAPATGEAEEAESECHMIVCM